MRVSSEEDPWGAAYKILRKNLKSGTQMVSLAEGGRIITDPTEIAHSMMDGLLPDDNSENERDDLREMRIQSAISVTDWQNDLVSREELRLAVFQQKNGKAPGLDGVRTEIVKRAFGWVGKALLCIVGEVFRLGTFPD